nr:MAG TPA: Ellis van Creveld protein 2 like protein [Caudoviricetes sp.]
MFSLIVLLYLADVCYGIHVACITVFIIIGLILCVGVLALMFYSECYDNEELKEKLLSWKKYVKNTVIAGVIAGIILALTPSQKTVYMIAGSVVVSQTVNEVISSDLYKRIYNIINDKLDSLVKADKD